MDPAAVIEATALAELQPILAATAQAGGHSEVQRFYQHSVVFLTGASGFLGKHLTEKLLRSCDISKLYVLLRPKKGSGIDKRVKEITNDNVFDTLRKQKPKFSDKIIAIEGDISELRLGIKEDDWKIITEEVTVIFHLAATTRFNEPLQTATLINVRGARETLLLGKACTKLKSYVHVSTAYSHARIDLIGCDVEESFYPAPVTPENIISMAESLDPDRLNNITPEFTKGWPNTYTFTKAIAEEQVRSMSAGLPVCIVRPAIGIKIIEKSRDPRACLYLVQRIAVAIQRGNAASLMGTFAPVLNSYKEPSPGWVDKSCIYGPVGLFLGTGLGVLHTTLADAKIKVGFIPCDYVNNAILVAAREAATSQLRGGNHTKIYTVCTTHRNPVTFGTINEILDTQIRKLFSPKSIYYCFIIITKNKYWYGFNALLWHIIPAHIADFVCVLFGKQRRFVKLNNKGADILNVMSYFSLNQWNFVDNNLESLYSSLTKQDQAIFNFDVTDLDWNRMFLSICIGLRKYIVKDGLKHTEYAIRKQKFLRILHYVVIILYGYIIWKIIYFMYFLGNIIINKN